MRVPQDSKLKQKQVHCGLYITISLQQEQAQKKKNEAFMGKLKWTKWEKDHIVSVIVCGKEQIHLHLHN